MPSSFVVGEEVAIARLGCDSVDKLSLVQKGYRMGLEGDKKRDKKGDQKGDERGGYILGLYFSTSYQCFTIIFRDLKSGLDKGLTRTRPI